MPEQRSENLSLRGCFKVDHVNVVSPAIYNSLNKDKHPSKGKKHGGAPAPLLLVQGRPLLKGGYNHSPFDLPRGRFFPETTL